MSPLVSVITRTKNRPLLLPRACHSVLAQTTTDWEHIIVNDGGDRAPVECLLAPLRAAYGERLRVLHHERSAGMEAASNRAIEAATGRYLVIHDDDDSWHPRFLEKTSAELESTGPESRVQGVVTHVTRIVEELTAEGARERLRHPFAEGLAPITLWRLLEENVFPPIAFLFRRTAWEQVGRFDESLPVLGDWDFNIRFLRRFELAVIPEMLAYYHHRDAPASSIYANTVGTRDALHRATERALIERWAASPDASLRALAAAAGDARATLLQRREHLDREAAIWALRSEIAALESQLP